MISKLPDVDTLAVLFLVTQSEPRLCDTSWFDYILLFFLCLKPRIAFWVIASPVSPLLL